MNPPVIEGHTTDLVLPCGTRSRRLTHLAKGETCHQCQANVDGPPAELYEREGAA